MYNLFYVESPLQMLSAISAVNKFDQYKAILIVDVSHDDRVNNNEQLLKCIGNEWHQVYIKKPRKGWAKTLKGMGLIKDIINLCYFSLKYRREIDRYFIGEYRSIDMAILNCFIMPKETILLDDGTFTITAQNHHITNKIPPYINGTKYKLFKPLLKNLATPNLYSFFDLESSLQKGQINYFELPRQKKMMINKGEIFFFGAKFSESKFMSMSDEIGVLSKIVKLFTGYEIFYVPHRDEKKSKINKISDLGFRIKSLGKPAEIYFDETAEMPEIVLSYYSTVLYTCYIRFNNVK